MQIITFNQTVGIFKLSLDSFFTIYLHKSQYQAIVALLNRAKLVYTLTIDNINNEKTNGELEIFIQDSDIIVPIIDTIKNYFSRLNENYDKVNNILTWDNIHTTIVIAAIVDELISYIDA